MSRLVASLSLRSDDAAPRGARCVLDDVAEIESIAGDVKLVASELVTNAVRHSGARADDLITMRVLVNHESVKIVVHDPGRSDQTPRVRHEPDLAVGGLGLLVVSRIARRWATERADGRLVWAELALAD